MTSRSGNRKTINIWAQISPSPREYEYRDDVSYLIVGGIKGLCGSIAVDLAKRGVKNIAVMSRTGYDGEEKSRMVLRHIKALGSHIDIIKGDITNIEDVRRAFSETRYPVGGIIQGAMVLFVSFLPGMSQRQH